MSVETLKPRGGTALIIACIGVLLTCMASAKVSALDSKEVVGRDFVKRILKGNYESATDMFDFKMKPAMSPSQLEQYWQGLIKQYGDFKTIGGSRSETVGEYEAVFVTCEFASAKVELKTVIDKYNKIGGIWIVMPDGVELPAPVELPTYVDQERFDEIGVLINRDTQWELLGMLTMPRGEGPFPAVALVHGSGPNDRDETLGPNKPFRDIAWGLASKGIAVLRYDKRTKVYPEEMARMDDLTVKAETINDALAAVSLLRKSDKINPKKVFVLGHSLGGMLIPRIGKADPKIAGLIVLAGNTRPLEDLVLEQITYITSLSGLPVADAKKEISKVKQQVAKVKGLKPSAKSSASSLILGAPASYWLDLRGYRPATMAKGLKQPMLIAQGGRDYQVTTADFKGWKNALSKQKRVTFKFYPDLNHLFMTGVGKSTPSEYDKPGFVAQPVMDDIAAWIGAH